MNVTGHDADFALTRRNDAGAVGSDQTRLVLLQQGRLDPDHVLGGDAFGDADGQANFGFHGVNDGLGGKRWRHIDDGGIGASRLTCLSHRVEHGQAQLGVGLAALAGRDAADHLRFDAELFAISDRLSRVERSLLSSEALDNQLNLFCVKRQSLSCVIIPLCSL